MLIHCLYFYYLLFNGSSQCWSKTEETQHIEDHQDRTISMIVPASFIDLRAKKLCQIAELNFLLLCRKHAVFPNFIPTPRLHRDFYFSRCLRRNQQALLRAAIKDSRSRLAATEKALYVLHTDLLFVLHPLMFERCDTISFTIASTIRDKKLRVLKSKLQRLIAKTRPKSQHRKEQQLSDEPICETRTTPETVSPVTSCTLKLNSPVVNLSDISLNAVELNCLSYNLNFALNVKDTPLDSLIAQLETGINRVAPIDKRDEIKINVKNILLNKKDTPPNPIHNHIRSTICNLKKKPIFVLRADKGGQVVVVNQTDYETATNSILNDKETYKRVNYNPLNRTLTRLKTLIYSCTSLNFTTQKKLIPAHHLLPLFYALPKVHKITISYRPIVANTGTIYNFVSKFVSEKIKFLQQYNTYSINNPLAAIDKLKAISIDETDILASLDIVSLYSNIPADEALICLETKLYKYGQNHLSILEIQDLLKLCSFCITNPALTHRNEFYLQIKGLAMGSSISSPLADIFMDNLETGSLFNYSLLPKSYMRYVDDAFLVWQHGMEALLKFFDYANTNHATIKFTIEFEANKNLPFLDIAIRREDNNLNFNVYRKPFAVSNPPHCISNHSWKQKMSFFECMTLRAYRYCSSISDRNNEIEYLKHIALNRGFNPEVVTNAVKKLENKLSMTSTTTLTSQKFSTKDYIVIDYIPTLSTKISNSLRKYRINTTLKPINKLQGILSNFKNKLKPELKFGIYSIGCIDCDMVYIGQTKRSLTERLKEHLRASNSTDLTKIQISAIALHAHKTKHSINWPTTVITQCQIQHLNILELIHIFKNRNNILNRKEENFLNKIWHNLYR